MEYGNVAALLFASGFPESLFLVVFGRLRASSLGYLLGAIFLFLTERNSTLFPNFLESGYVCMKRKHPLTMRV